jgi:hypothetical protein
MGLIEKSLINPFNPPSIFTQSKKSSMCCKMKNWNTSIISAATLTDRLMAVLSGFRT